MTREDLVEIDDDEDDYCLAGDQEWEPTPDEQVDVPKIRKNTYIDNLYKSSGLKINHGGSVRNAFDRAGPLGLFRLFYTKNRMELHRQWTNDELRKIGVAPCSSAEYEAADGLELAMSIENYNAIADYWASGAFLGCSTFQRTMARDRFFAIRSHRKIHPDGIADDDKLVDPLWFSRSFFDAFRKRSADLATLQGTVALDEMTQPTRCQNRAVSYMKSKPDKYGIRFYGLVGWRYLYLYSVVDNGSGNIDKTPPANRYIGTFPKLVTMFRKFADKSSPANNKDEPAIDPSSPSAVWLMQMAHMAKSNPSGTNHCFTDNFYTRHSLARGIDKITDGNTKLTGTCRLNFVDAVNKKLVAEAHKRVSEGEQGDWLLVPAYTAVDLDLKKDYKLLQKSWDKIKGPKDGN